MWTVAAVFTLEIILEASGDSGLLGRQEWIRRQVPIRAVLIRPTPTYTTQGAKCSGAWVLIYSRVQRQRPAAKLSESTRYLHWLWTVWWLNGLAKTHLLRNLPQSLCHKSHAVTSLGSRGSVELRVTVGEAIRSGSERLAYSSALTESHNGKQRIPRRETDTHIRFIFIYILWSAPRDLPKSFFDGIWKAHKCA